MKAGSFTLMKWVPQRLFIEFFIIESEISLETNQLNERKVEGEMYQSQKRKVAKQSFQVWAPTAP